ncbi:MAG: amidohydrolase [Bacteroidota bacterium]
MLAAPTPSLSPTQSDDAFGHFLTSLRRHLHRYPEVGFREVKTSRHLRALLRSHGFETVGPLAETGFYVEVEGAHPGPTVAYRTELDALPAPDGKDCDYASQHPDVAHLCGHDAHMAVAVGVALLLQERRGDLHGTARILFQPNEESCPSGAPAMIEEEALDGVDEIFCIHVDPSLEVGQFGLIVGSATAATAPFVVRVSGPAGHSARPHETVDTVWVATQILNTFYQLPGRVHDARRSAVLTACRFRGGEALNVIPRAVEFGGTLRCVSLEGARTLAGAMREAAEDIGRRYGAEIEIDMHMDLPPVVNAEASVEHVCETVQDLLGENAAHTLHEPSMGGEDFAFYLQQIPGMLLRVGTASSEATRYPLHHARFDLTEAALPATARLMAEVVARRLAP